MLMAQLIARKRDGGALLPDEWRAIVAGVTDGTVTDHHAAALLMAVFFRGLTPEELDVLTDAMRDSGSRLAFGDGVPPRVDKHSTGGIGDKTSLILAPLVAACGLAVPMISGRGLGHTGGTLDKLEAIPGFRTDLTLDEAQRQVERLGCVMLGQTADLTPADRRLYALRDATGTVEAIPLIAASIMSKKLAEDLQGLVLDIKVGSGAFLPEPARARELAHTMIGLGAARGCPTVALLTAMDRPLGHACGNALETEEAFLALRGEGPADHAIACACKAHRPSSCLALSKAPTTLAAVRSSQPSGLPEQLPGCRQASSEAARAAAMVELTSPTTTTQSGRSAKSTGATLMKFGRGPATTSTFI